MSKGGLTASPDSQAPGARDGKPVAIVGNTMSGSILAEWHGPFCAGTGSYATPRTICLTYLSELNECIVSNKRPSLPHLVVSLVASGIRLQLQSGWDKTLASLLRPFCTADFLSQIVFTAVLSPVVSGRSCSTSCLSCSPRQNRYVTFSCVTRKSLRAAKCITRPKRAAEPARGNGSQPALSMSFLIDVARPFSG